MDLENQTLSQENPTDQYTLTTEPFEQQGAAALDIRDFPDFDALHVNEVDLESPGTPGTTMVLKGPDLLRAPPGQSPKDIPPHWHITSLSLDVLRHGANKPGWCQITLPGTIRCQYPADQAPLLRLASKGGVLRTATKLLLSAALLFIPTTLLDDDDPDDADEPTNRPALAMH